MIVRDIFQWVDRPTEKKHSRRVAGLRLVFRGMQATLGGGSRRAQELEGRGNRVQTGREERMDEGKDLVTILLICTGNVALCEIPPPSVPRASGTGNPHSCA